MGEKGARNPGAEHICLLTVCSSVTARDTLDAASHEHLRLSVQVCQPGGTAAHPCTARPARASLSSPASLQAGNTSENGTLSAGSLCEAQCEQPQQSTGASSSLRWKEAVPVVLGQEEEGEGKGRGKMTLSSEIWRGRGTAAHPTNCRAQVSNTGSYTRLLET